MKKLDYKGIILEILGSALISISLYNFAAQAKFPMTGFSGISLILYRLFRISLGISTVILNIPVALISYRLLGKKFFWRSIRCIIISSAMIDIIAPMLPVYRGERILAAICTGILSGIGYALIYMQNSSTGGADFIIMSIKAILPHVELGSIAFLISIGIILVSGILFHDVDGIIYGIMISYISCYIINKAMLYANASKLALIVTKKGELISANIIKNSSHWGSAIIKAFGEHKQNDKEEIILCACKERQIHQLKKTIKEIDPFSLIIILDSLIQ